MTATQPAHTHRYVFQEALADLILRIAVEDGVHLFWAGVYCHAIRLSEVGHAASEEERWGRYAQDVCAYLARLPRADPEVSVWDVVPEAAPDVSWVTFADGNSSPRTLSSQQRAGQAGRARRGWRGWRLVCNDHAAEIERLLADVERLTAGADESRPDPGAWLTPGQMWSRLLSMPVEGRLNALGNLSDRAAEGESCFMRDHNQRVADAEGQVAQLRRRFRLCDGCDATWERCDAIDAPAIKCCPDCRHAAPEAEGP